MHVNGRSSGLQSAASHVNSFFISDSPGQIHDVSLSQEESAAEIEVTPDLDLEVVPESGEWHTVFP